VAWAAADDRGFDTRVFADMLTSIERFADAAAAAAARRCAVRPGLSGVLVAVLAG
jgi:hypothetical protein